MTTFRAGETETAGPGPADRPGREGLYVISVAARLLDMHPQTLRKYEREGLVRPLRTEGNGRLYSEEDLARLRFIKHLVDRHGLNLSGVKLTMALLSHLAALRRQARQVPEPQLRDVVERSIDRVFELLEGSWNNG